MPMCKGKVRYGTRERAVKAATRYSRIGIGYSRIYECPACKGFHLTTKPLRPPR